MFAVYYLADWGSSCSAGRAEKRDNTGFLLGRGTGLILEKASGSAITVRILPLCELKSLAHVTASCVCPHSLGWENAPG